MNELELKRERDEAVKRKGAYEEGLRQNTEVMKELTELLKCITPQMRDMMQRLGVDISFIDSLDKERLQCDKDYLDSVINTLYSTALGLNKSAVK